jgi:hypothetical protein
MSTTTISGSGHQDRSMARSRTTGIHIGRIGIGTVGALTVLVSAWGGIVPFIGPAFGYSADGTGSWHWDLTHAVLGLVPGAIGVVAGLLILAEIRGIDVGRGRMSLTMAGMIALLCGAWFIVGPLTWPVVSTHGAYFATTATPLRELANQVGYALGTGLILVGCGGFVIGWASRHQLKATATGPAAEATSANPDPVPEAS